MKGFLKRVSFLTHPLDRFVVGLIAVLWLVLGLLLIWGDRTRPQVRDFSWAEESVGAEDIAFTLTFNRPMNWDSVSQQIQISPALPGKTSWSGRRLAYTLTRPAPYGQSFQLTLDGAKAAAGGAVVPFNAQFKSRDLAFAYLGVNGDEAGRIVLYNLTQDKKTVVTPANLSVHHFKAYPKGDRLLFTATDRSAANPSELNSKLYKATTGLADTQLGQVDLVLDNQDYQILKFDLSANGDRIVVQRSARQNASETGLWQIRGSGTPEPIKIDSAGDFLLAPDSETLVAAQGKGLAIIPLEQKAAAEQVLDFLPQYGMVLNFARDGSAATMVKFNTDYTRSLFLVSSQGDPRELLRTTGSILSTTFTAQRDALYCLLTRLITGKDYQEQPFIAKIDLKTGKPSELLTLPLQRNVTLSLAPDGSQLLFDRGTATTAGGSAQPVPANIWSLALTESNASPKVVAVGAEPQWLP
ncbi:hypothetical protein [Altericista sp. CCNU0014]|uniref:hypothetical protein n=1 Tax=Altericista sp. CCNU0014 TaxID=3082949 RepID=UPI0038505937